MSRTEAMNPILNTGEASPWQQASFPGVQGRSPPKHGLVLPSAGGRPAEEVLQGRGQPGDGCWGAPTSWGSYPVPPFPTWRSRASDTGGLAKEDVVWILVGSGGCKTIQRGLAKREELSKIPNFSTKSWARSRARRRSGKVLVWCWGAQLIMLHIFWVKLFPKALSPIPPPRFGFGGDPPPV